MMNWTFGHIDFSTYPTYNEKPLGISYSHFSTWLRVWSPTASSVNFRLYDHGDKGKFISEHSMVKGEHGVWEIRIDGNFHGFYYTIQCLIDGIWMNEIPDPYAFAVGVNGKRGLICDFQSINPAGWNRDQRQLPDHYTDMVLYELHVRDFSIDSYSGIQNKGQYLAFTETGTRSPEGVRTGLDHLVELGITHVHLLPIFDFLTVDEAHSEKKDYNWGYDPLNFNALEGSYSSNPYDGIVRIREFKQLVKSLHSRGIGVIMDVVYNHTGLIFESYLNHTVPGYYYRQRRNGTFSDASGCGTEIASERTMVRKYIIDSLKFWVNEFHLDGFRFDLMGVYDIETMNLIRSEMDQIDPKLVLYGEGWTAASSPLDEKYRAVKSNTPKLNGIAVFNDDFRDAMKGHWGDESSIGFASGQTLNEESVKYGIVAATFHSDIVYNYVSTSKWAWSLSPNQSINYVSCHDNYTLYDKLKKSRPEASLQELTRMACLAGAVLLTSQGIPFLHAGVEMLRTKRGHGNSYNVGDEINQIDWSRKAMFSHVNDYFKGLISIRKNHPAFRMTLTEDIQKHLKFSTHYMPGVVSFQLIDHANGDCWKRIKVIFNNNPNPIVFPIKRRNWREIVNGLAIDENGLSVHVAHSVFVPAISMMMLVSEE